MRPLALVIIVLASSLAQAQQALPPAPAQADDAEVPGSPPPPVPLPPPPIEAAPPMAAPPVIMAPARVPLLLAPVAPGGYQYRIVDGPPRQVRRWGDRKSVV